MSERKQKILQNKNFKPFGALKLCFCFRVQEFKRLPLVCF